MKPTTRRPTPSSHPSLQRRDVLHLSALCAITSFSAPAALAQSRRPRLVSVSGALTEVVYLLGAQEQLVGTDSTSLFPLAAQQTPKVGYMRQLSAEGLLALKPDAVIATTEVGPPLVLEQIRSAGIKVVLVTVDHSWAEVQRKVAAVGRAAGREAQARELQRQLDADWAQALQVVGRHRGRKPRVLFILAHSATPLVAGEATAAHALIGFIGGDNVMRGFTGYRPMTAEAMAAAAPDVILSSSQGLAAMGGVDTFWARPELALTPAFRRRASPGALVHMDALQLLGFGPRLAQTVRDLHAQLVLA